MAVQTPGSITSEALLRLTDLHFNEAEAKLKAERATAIKSVEGRQMLPNVATKLAELEQKKAQQKAKIAKQAEEQGVSQKSLLPPMIDVTGQTSGRSPQAALTAASEIAKQVSGGSGIKQGMIGGVFGQQQAPQQAPQQNAPSQNQAVPAQTSPAGQAVPGQQVPIQRQLSGLEQYLAAPAQVLLGFASRSPAAVVAGVHDLATGMQSTGQYEQLPTVAEMGKNVAQRLWGAQQGLTGSAAAMNDEFTNIMNRYGPEVAKQVGTAAIADAAEMEYKHQEAKNAPTYKLQEKKWDITQKVAAGESLSPGDQLIADSLYGRDKGKITINNIIPDTTRNDMGKAIESSRDLIAGLNQIDRAFYPQYFTYFKSTGRIPTAIRSTYAQLGADVSPEGQQKLAQFSALDTALGIPALQTAHDLLGAYMSPLELVRYDRAYAAFSTATDAVTARTNLDMMRESAGLAIVRKVHALSLSPDADASAWMELGDGRALAIGDTDKYARKLVEERGMDPQQAIEEAFQRTEQMYGLRLRDWPEYQQRR